MSDDKGPQSGLVDMGDISFYNDPTHPIPAFSISDLANYPGSFSEMVLNVTWAQLEPTSGTLDTSVISSALSAVSAYNTTHPGEEIGVKLRVWGGFVAPDWAKNIDGAPITVTGQGEVTRGFFGSQTIGRFWTADYVDTWTSFQAQLAAAYDSNPLILGISQTAGAAATDEPFVPLFFDPSQHENQPGQLEAGGYSDAAEMLTLRAAIADYSEWSTAPLDFTFNIFFLQDSGRPEGDANFPLAVLQQARDSTRLVQPGNHALTSLLDDSNAFVYHQMAADAALDPSTAPGSYQMQAPIGLGGFGNWPSTVSTGVGANGGDIEAWNFPGTSGFLGLPPAIVQSLSEIIAAGVAPVTGAPADGSALGFIAPAYVTAATSTAAFTGTDAVLLATAVAQHRHSDVSRGRHALRHRPRGHRAGADQRFHDHPLRPAGAGEHGAGTAHRHGVGRRPGADRGDRRRRQPHGAHHRRAGVVEFIGLSRRWWRFGLRRRDRQQRHPSDRRREHRARHPG
jgi:hypothetical protein